MNTPTLAESLGIPQATIDKMLLARPGDRTIGEYCGPLKPAPEPTPEPEPVETKDAWVIRPTVTPTGHRRFLPVAILATGEEVEVYRAGIYSFETVREARVFIIAKWDGGRRFPTVRPSIAAGVCGAEDSRIADSFKGIYD